MDPRDRADAVLERASALRRGVVTPINATSPMDASATSRIRRSVVEEAQRRVEEQDTQSIPAPGAPREGEETTQPVRDVREGATQPVHRPQAAAPHAEQRVAEDEPTTDLGGLIPTVAQQPKKPRSLSERLSGLD
ncbi:hypothetical protein [Sciscionella sediminilitoris]|uniref:hypothetical protein n=1 Tax=Sciscionella sediminilitoris TaxID=1445613 RepID=UPI0004DF3DD9|nr:hypothetical protein [Sciscionella sp. SE31]